MACSFSEGVTGPPVRSDGQAAGKFVNPGPGDVGEVEDVLVPVFGWACGDNVKGTVEHLIDKRHSEHSFCEGCCSGEGLGEGFWSVSGIEGCGVLPWREDHLSWVEAVRDEEPVISLGGLLPGWVVVGGNDRGRVPVGELAGLGGGEAGAQGGDADVTATGGEGDGDGIHWAFNQDRGAHVGGVVTGGVELVTFAVDHGVAGVEIFGSAPVFVGQVGVSASDEPENLPPAGVGEGEDDAVPETVDESSGADAGSQASGEEFVSGRALSSQVGGEAGPTVRGVTRSQLRVAGQVDAEPVSQVALTPRAGVPGLVVVEGLGVEIDKPFRGNVGVVEVEGTFQLGVQFPLG